MGFSNVQGVAGINRTHGTFLCLDGVEAAAAIKQRVSGLVKERIASGQGAPGLATILVGDDPASATYVGAKHRACAEVGIESLRHELPEEASEGEVEHLISALNSERSVTGILLQLPLPRHLDAAPLIEMIDPAKDVDGLTVESQGRLAGGEVGHAPCTPSGVISLLDHFKVPIEGRRAVVVGRSRLVGAPMATLLTQRDATVTLCHSRTRDLRRETSNAEILIAAAGIPNLIGANHVATGSVVIDVGIHRTHAGLVGDVDSVAVRDKVRALTPVPGGVGPMTIASLMSNTVAAGEQGRHG